MRPLAAAASLALAALALAAGCAGDPAPWPPDPAAVRLGEDECAACRMIISDDGFGAQLHHRSGRVEHFDDLGCLLYAAGTEPVDPQAVFTRAVDDAGWVRGDQAVIVRAPGIRSPMGYDLMAFADRASAEKEAARFPDAAITTLRELLEQPDLRPAAPHMEDERK